MQLPDGFFWEPNDHVAGALWLVRAEGHLIVGSVFPRIDSGWVSQIDRHLPRSRSARAPSRRAAIKQVRRWCWARASQLASFDPAGRALRTWAKPTASSIAGRGDVPICAQTKLTDQGGDCHVV